MRSSVSLSRCFKMSSATAPITLSETSTSIRPLAKADIEFHNLMIEAKRYASGHWYKPEWWEQAKTSAGDTHIPSADI